MNRITEQQAAANAFILQRTAQIERFIRSFLWKYGKGLPIDEYRQEVYFQVIRRHHALRLENAQNPESVISTWLGWQCRAAMKTLRRHRNRYEALRESGRVFSRAPTQTRHGGCEGETEAVLDRMATTPVMPGHADRMEYGQEVMRILAVADEEQMVAAVSILHGWSPRDLKEHLNISVVDRDRALRSLAAKVQRGRHDRGNGREVA